jgi:hypothetical protein
LPPSAPAQIKARDIEKRGRVQSSTITITITVAVAVLDDAIASDVVIRESDLEWSACRSPDKEYARGDW